MGNWRCGRPLWGHDLQRTRCRPAPLRWRIQSAQSNLSSCCGLCVGLGFLDGGFFRTGRAGCDDVCRLCLFDFSGGPESKYSETSCSSPSHYADRNPRHQSQKQQRHPGDFHPDENRCDSSFCFRHTDSGGHTTAGEFPSRRGGLRNNHQRSLCCGTHLRVLCLHWVERGNLSQ